MPWHPRMRESDRQTSPAGRFPCHERRGQHGLFIVTDRLNDAGKGRADTKTGRAFAADDAIHRPNIDRSTAATTSRITMLG